MNAMLNYFIEVNLAFILFYLGYWLLLRHEHQFSFKRSYLLASLMASLLFPLITIPDGEAQFIPSLSNSAAEQWLPEITIYADATPDVKTATQTPTWQWITYIYGVGLMLFSILFVIRVVSLIRLFRTSKKYNWKNYLVVESEKSHGSFSFFHFIFLGQASDLSEQEKQDVLIHEEVHAQKKHSFDIILINILGIAFWFNPIMRLYRNSFVQVHEFEADACSIEGRDVNTYCSLLARVALHSNGYPLANHFTNSLTLKRINMIKTAKKKINQWKLVTTSFVILLIFFVIACQDQVDQAIGNAAKSSSVTLDLPTEVKRALERMQAENPESKFEVIELNDKGKEYLNKKYPSENSKITFTTGSAVSVIQDSGSKRQFMIIGENEKLKRIAGLSKNERDVYTNVHETARPYFGMDVFYKNIAHSIIYPAEARKNAQQGKVYLEFIVETNGDISNVNIARGVSEYLDEEALRVFLQTQSKWIPAFHNEQVVRQKMVLPITFKFSDPKQNMSFTYFDLTRKIEEFKVEKSELNEIVVVGQNQKKD